MDIYPLIIMKRSVYQVIKLMHKRQYSLKSQHSFKQINQSPTNCSVSKQAHSFGKCSRFPLLKTQCPILSYNGDYIRSKRSGASIGIGNKSDFTKDLTCSPGSNRYDIKSKLDQALSADKGYSVGKGRKQVVFYSYIDRQQLRTPPLNKYQVSHENIKIKHPIYSMGSRTKLINKSMTIEPQNNNPGPGDYDNINNILIHNSSEYGNLKFSADRSRRFPNYDNRIPGPASYNEVLTISSDGKYSISKIPSSISPKFSQSERRTKFDEAAKKSLETPGAGSYRAPSQFGNYDEPFGKLNRIHIPSFGNLNSKMKNGR